MDKIQELKQLVGEDVAGEILAASDKLTTRAKRLGLKFKEADMPNNFAEFMAAYKAYQAFNAEAVEEAELDEALDEQEVEIEVEKEITTKMDTAVIEQAVMKAVKAAFGEMRAGEDMEDDDKAKAKELDEVKATNAQLLQTVKALSDRVAALEQPIAPQLNGGFRVTDNPQETGKALSGASHNGTVAVLDMLGGIQ
jgi:hypothetical protein